MDAKVNIGKNFIYFISCFFCFSIACSEDDDIISRKTIGTFQIGYEGGTITHNELSIDIAQGCFSNATDIELLENKNNISFENHESSSFYTINGLPTNFDEPIEVTLSGNSNELLPVLGETVQKSGEGGVSNSFRFPEMTQYEQEYTFYINPFEYTDQDSFQVTVGLVKDYVKVESTNAFSTNNINSNLKSTDTEQASSHFVVYAPSAYINEALDLQQNLDDAYNYLKSSKMGFSYSKRTNWPVQATIKKLKEGVYGYFVPSKWGDNYGTLEFSTSYVSDKEQNRVSAIHEFFHLVQNLYDPRYGFTKAVSSSDYYWVKEAASVWSEGLFANSSNYVSKAREGHINAPFAGITEGARENAAHHGYGMSALFKYIADNYGQSAIRKIFENQKKGSRVSEAINAAIPDRLTDIYVDFIDDYIQQKVYDDFSATNIFASYNDKFDIKTENDTLKVYEETYPSMSAKIYRIDFNYNGFDERNSLLISNTYGPQKLIYKVSGSDATLLKKTIDDYELPNLKALHDNNETVLVVVVSRNYTDQEDALELKVKTMPPLTYNRCKFSFGDLPVVHEVTRFGQTSTQELYYDFTYDNYYRPGEYKDGMFTSEWDEVDGGWRHIGELTITIDEQSSQIIEGSIIARIESTSNPEEAYKEMELSFKNITGNLSDLHGSFISNNGDFCNSLTFYDATEDMNGFYRTTKSYECNNKTYLEITLKSGDD